MPLFRVPFTREPTIRTVYIQQEKQEPSTPTSCARCATRLPSSGFLCTQCPLSHHETTDDARKLRTQANTSSDWPRVLSGVPQGIPTTSESRDEDSPCLPNMTWTPSKRSSHDTTDQRHRSNAQNRGGVGKLAEQLVPQRQAPNPSCRPFPTHENIQSARKASPYAEPPTKPVGCRRIT